MIRGFRSRALKRFYERGEDRHINAEHRDIVRDILARVSTPRPPLKT